MISVSKCLNCGVKSPAAFKFRMGLLLVLVSATILMNSSALKAQAKKQSGRMLTLEMAILQAQEKDLWITGNLHAQKAVMSQSVVAGTLPDPKLSVSMANLPVDSFDFSQEAMTQFKLGFSQKLPQGDTLQLKQKQLQQLSSQFPYQRQARKAELALIVSQLWLETYKAEKSIALIEKNRSLFEQLADVAQASYSSAVGKTRQQDIVRAQLELIRLEDRLTQLKQHKEVHWQKLSEWLSNEFVSQFSFNNVNRKSRGNIEIAKQPPDIKLNNRKVTSLDWSQQQLTELLSGHPSILTLEKKIETSAIGVELARQKYKPSWEFSASYGYREDDLLGNDRADLFSIGVSFELPLFTDNRQDKQVETAIENTSAVKTEKWLKLRKMLAEFESTRSELLRLSQRQTLYRNQLIPQMHQQAEASLTAYTNDDGDFAEVVRARIAQLNAEIDELAIDVMRQQAVAKINYFLVGSRRLESVAGYLTNTYSTGASQ
ncbi:TolC family protein [Aliikangiella coralliicola]|uniref:TolC family protein n=1 Tax=Aliikangiella coralliicola TaxID=2592383 RepID=A0A545U7N8_9GAMM|nr:TolC family protein [Aliikangiella coralliicola]TQV85484.1 TolC family protein [Aliikangiella coralliicola]